jgi:hypothetical protein
MVLLHKFEKHHISARAIFIATTCEEQSWLNLYITTKVALLVSLDLVIIPHHILFVTKQITIHGPKRTVWDHVETWQFHSLLGLKKGVLQTITFNSAAHQVMSPFLTVGTHNIVWLVYHLIMGFWLLATCWMTQPPSTYIERIVNSNYGHYSLMDFSSESVVDGIFDFSQEDEIIKWVVGNLTCEQAMQRNATYACVSRNSYCQNVTRGKHCMGINASVPMASKEIHTCKIIVQVIVLSQPYILIHSFINNKIHTLHCAIRSRLKSSCMHLLLVPMVYMITHHIG